MIPTRRSFVWHAAMAAGALATPRFVLAQSRASQVQGQIDQNLAQARSLLQEVRKSAPRLNVDLAQTFANREVALRRQLADILRRVPPAGLDEYVQESERDTAAALRDAKIPLVPDDKQIAPVKVVAPPAALPGCKETLRHVVTDIVFSAIIGPPDVRDMLLEIISSDPEMDKRLKELSESLGTGDPARTIDVMIAATSYLVKKLSDSKAVQTLAQKVASRLLPRFAVKLVPFAGPIYVGVNLGIATLQSWDRLVVAAKC